MERKMIPPETAVVVPRGCTKSLLPEQYIRRCEQMKEYTKEERYNIAFLLDSVLSADLDMMDDEVRAIEAAIEIVSPEFVADKKQDEQEAVEWYNSLTPEQIKETAENFLDKLEKSDAGFGFNDKMIDFDKHKGV